MKKLACFVLLATGLLFSGCASGPQFTDVRNTLPPLAPDKGRIFFFRPSVLGAAVQPDVKLNGDVVGSAKSKGAFYVDRAPGDFTVETSTEVTRKLSLTLDKGQTRYVQLNIAMGFMVGHVYPELVDASVGEAGLAKCKFTGGGK
jgi:Protein of unknown function (DUF2846)